MALIAPSVDTMPSMLGFLAPAQQDDPFGVYIHIPFCTHVCPYCDFNTYAGQADRIPAYIDAVKRETALWAARFSGRIAGSMFIGGGTPSLLDAKSIGEILTSCRATFDVAADAEVTIESNPNNLSEPYCFGLLEAGVNRVSIGAQTLDRKGLRVLGRRHESTATTLAVRSARAAGFANVSLDFIYGWPGQSLAQWQNDLDRVLAGEIGGSTPDHLSLYGLIVEPGTPMADAVQRGILAPVGDDESAEFADLAASRLTTAGWVHYEIANWAASREKCSRHNAIYWRNGAYAGIGAGAHGYVGARRTMNHLLPRAYIAAISNGRSPISNTEIISEQTAMGETMMLGLRLLQDGVSPKAFESRHGVSMSAQFGHQLSRLRDLGLLIIETDRVRLTERGASLANSVCAEFL